MKVIVRDLTCQEDVLDSNNTIFLFFVGYEKRSVSMLQKLELKNPANVLCWTFDLKEQRCSADENRKLVKSLGHEIIEISDQCTRTLVATILTRISECGFQHLAIDYSSLPRRIYTAFINCLDSEFLSIRVSFWYVNGSYTKPKVFPCVGVGDWALDLDRGRIQSEFRSTLIGLGFDWTRTYGILDKLNPQEIYCVSTCVHRDDQIHNTVKSRNEEIIGMSQNFVSYPINSMNEMYHGVRDLVVHLLDEGDVELIPDGPKPLIMAMTLVSKFVNRLGISCWRIRHGGGAQALDVFPSDPFLVSGFEIEFVDNNI